MRTTVIVAIVAVVVLLGLGGALTKIGPWYRGLNKPSWNPPDWLFGPAWTVILGLVGWVGVMAWDAARTPAAHTALAVAIGVNMLCHAVWSPLFFMARRPDWSLIESVFLWSSCVVLTYVYGQFSDAARWTVVPYVLWGHLRYLPQLEDRPAQPPLRRPHRERYGMNRFGLIEMLGVFAVALAIVAWQLGTPINPGVIRQKMIHCA